MDDSGVINHFFVHSLIPILKFLRWCESRDRKKIFRQSEIQYSLFSIVYPHPFLKEKRKIKASCHNLREDFSHSHSRDYITLIHILV